MIRLAIGRRIGFSGLDIPGEHFDLLAGLLPVRLHAQRGFAAHGQHQQSRAHDERRGARCHAQERVAIDANFPQLRIRAGGLDPRVGEKEHLRAISEMNRARHERSARAERDERTDCYQSHDDSGDRCSVAA